MSCSIYPILRAKQVSSCSDYTYKMEYKPYDAFTSESSSTAFEKLSPPLLLEEEYEPFDSPFDEEISVP